MSKFIYLAEFEKEESPYIDAKRASQRKKRKPKISVEMEDRAISK